MQTLIQEKLDHQVKLHVDHIKLQNNISELSEQIIAASEVCLKTSVTNLDFVQTVQICNLPSQALQSSEEARLAAESRSNEFDANVGFMIFRNLLIFI